jgi:hypothetical protein
VNKIALGYTFKIFIIHRLLITLLGVGLTLALNVSGADVAGIYLGKDYDKNRIYLVPPELTPPTEGIGLYLISPFQRWDSEHYLTIAARGYGYNPSLVSFPPLFSVLTGLLGRILFGQYLLAGLIVSNVGYFLSLLLLYLLTARRWGEVAAQNTCKWLAFFPTAFFFMMPYSESLFLAFALAAFYYCEDERWLIGCFCGVLAGLTRLQGVILVLPLLVIYYKKYCRFTIYDLRFTIKNLSSSIVQLIKGWRWRWALVPVLLVPVGFISYQIYVYFFPPYPASNVVANLSSYFYVRVATPFETLFWAVVRPFQAFANGEAILNLWNFSDILGLVMVLWALWVGRKLLPAEYQLYAWATLLILLTRTGENFSLVSMLRYLVTMFPAFMVVGVGLSQNLFPRIKYNRRLILTLAAIFQTLFAGFFIIWWWAG